MVVNINYFPDAEVECSLMVCVVLKCTYWCLRKLKNSSVQNSIFQLRSANLQFKCLHVSKVQTLDSSNYFSKYLELLLYNIKKDLNSCKCFSITPETKLHKRPLMVFMDISEGNVSDQVFSRQYFADHLLITGAGKRSVAAQCSLSH